MAWKVLFCTPTRVKPHPAYVEALKNSIPLITGAGYAECYTFESGNPYISAARATMLKKGLDAKCDMFVFLDDDLSWAPGDLLKLVETPGDVVAGTYRTKEDNINYMGNIRQDARGFPTNVREDGCIQANCVPAGFLKVTKEAVDKFMKAYPHLCYGPGWDQKVDLFNHGAYKGLWWGEDYAFCRNWNDLGEKVWLIPDLNINHHSWIDDKVYEGNFHEYLMRQPGGKLGPPLDDSKNGIENMEGGVRNDYTW